MSIRKLSRGISLGLEERRRLRSPSLLQIAIADRFSQLNESAWNEVTATGSFFHSAAYQRAFERFRPPNIEPRFALISRGDEPLAAVSLQIAHMDLSQVGGGTRRRKLGLDRLSRRVGQRVLICGNLLAYGLHGVCFAPGTPKARMGCVPEPTSIWVRHRHPMLNKIVQPLLTLVEADEAPVFTPFKTAKG